MVVLLTAFESLWPGSSQSPPFVRRECRRAQGQVCYACYGQLRNVGVLSQQHLKLRHQMASLSRITPFMESASESNGVLSSWMLLHRLRRLICSWYYSCIKIAYLFRQASNFSCPLAGINLHMSCIMLRGIRTNVHVHVKYCLNLRHVT